jgi:hypothetical protein
MLLYKKQGVGASGKKAITNTPPSGRMKRTFRVEGFHIIEHQVDLTRYSSRFCRLCRPNRNGSVSLQMAGTKGGVHIGTLLASVSVLSKPVEHYKSQAKGRAMVFENSPHKCPVSGSSDLMPGMCSPAKRIYRRIVLKK